MAVNPDIKRGLHRNFQRYTHADRALIQASHRLGHRQREQIGEVFWTHDSIPNRAFDTRKQAVIAASRKLGIPAYDTDGASSVRAVARHSRAAPAAARSTAFGSNI